MKNAAILATGVLLSISSACRNKERRSSERLTPMGYHVEIPRLAELDADVVLEWVDRRITKWIELHKPDHDEGVLRRVALSIRYYLVDDYRFESRASTTGFAAGEYYKELRIVRASIYARGVSQDEPTSPPAASHLIRRNEAEETWSYGYIPDGGGCQVISHELDHAIGIGH